MLKFDIEAFIKELESIEGVEETPLDYEEYEASLIWEYEASLVWGESETERSLRGGL